MLSCGATEEHEPAVRGHTTRGLQAPRRIGLVLLCQSILALAASSSTESIDDTCFCIKILMCVGLETALFLKQSLLHLA